MAYFDLYAELLVDDTVVCKIPIYDGTGEFNFDTVDPVNISGNGTNYKFGIGLLYASPITYDNIMSWTSSIKGKVAISRGYGAVGIMVSKTGSLTPVYYRSGVLEFTNSTTLNPHVIGLLLVDGVYYPAVFNQNSTEVSRYIPYTTNNMSVTGFTTSSDLEIGGGATAQPPYSPSGPSSPGGGGGTFGEGQTSDTVDTATVPNQGSYASTPWGAFTTTYLMDRTTLTTVGNYMFQDNWFDALGKVALDLLSSGGTEGAIVSLQSLPFDPVQSTGLQGLSIGDEWIVYIGNVPVSDAHAPILTNDTVYIDWGTLTYSDRWFGNFLDQYPYTKCDLYLPFSTGFVSLNVGEFYPGTINIITTIDLTTGTCVHKVFVSSDEHPEQYLSATYQGVVTKNIPVTGDAVASKMRGAVISGVSLAVNAVGLSSSTVAADSALQGASSSAAKSATVSEMAELSYKGPQQAKYAESLARAKAMHEQNRVNNISDANRHLDAKQIYKGKVRRSLSETGAAMLTPPTVMRNGNFSDGVGGLMPLYPYLVFSRPMLNVPDNYGHLKGYPSNIYAQLSTLSGYTEVDEVHWSGMSCTAVELKEIDTLMKGGVVL